MKHEITEKRGGEMYMSWIKPVCSCGWQGKEHYAYNDWQITNYYDEIKSHYETVRKEHEIRN